MHTEYITASMIIEFNLTNGVVFIAELVLYNFSARQECYRLVLVMTWLEFQAGGQRLMMIHNYLLYWRNLNIHRSKCQTGTVIQQQLHLNYTNPSTFESTINLALKTAWCIGQGIRLVNHGFPVNCNCCFLSLIAQYWFVSGTDLGGLL